jgi:hypothetical protein
MAGVPARWSKSKRNRRDVDVDFVEEASIQALLDGVGAVDPNGLPGAGGDETTLSESAPSHRLTASWYRRYASDEIRIRSPSCPRQDRPLP